MSIGSPAGRPQERQQPVRAIPQCRNEDLGDVLNDSTEKEK
jgi:hypothetical protein